MAHHYSRSEDKEKSLDYLVKAGHKARDRYANATAIDYYSRALGTLEQIAENDETNTHNLELKYDIIAAREIVYDVIGDRENQKADIEAMINLAEALVDNLRLSDAYNREAWMHSNVGDYHRAQSLAEKAVVIKREIDDQSGEAESLHYIGSCYWHRGDYEQALRYVKQALQIREALDDKRGIGRELSVLGVVYWTLNYYKEALHYIESAVQVRKEVGDRKGLGAALNNLGLVYAELGLYQKALSCYQEALTVEEGIREQYLQGLLFGNIGTAYRYLDEYDKARLYRHKALSLARAMKATYIVVESLYELACIHYREGKTTENFNQALLYATEAERIAREAALTSGIIWSLSYQGIIHLAQNNTKEALRCSQQAVSMLEQQKNLEGSEEEIYFNHFQILRANNLMLEAEPYLQLAYKGITTKLEKITDAELRHIFVEKVRVHQEILREWQNK